MKTNTLNRTEDCMGCDRGNCRGGVYRTKRGYRACWVPFRCPGKILPKSGFKFGEMLGNHPETSAQFVLNMAECGISVPVGRY